MQYRAFSWCEKIWESNGSLDMDNLTKFMIVNPLTQIVIINYDCSKALLSIWLPRN